MIKYILSICLITSIVFGGSNYEQRICDRAKIISKQARILHDKFNDLESALILMNGSEFKKILSYKSNPSCLSKEDFTRFINQYAHYLSGWEHGNEYTFKTLIANHPKNRNLHLYLGDMYFKQYEKTHSTKFRQKALNSYKKYVELSKEGEVLNENILEIIKNGGLQKAKSTWGQYLNPSNNIPTNRYKAFYINTNNPKKIIATELVKRVSVNYPYNKFHNIDSKDFGAYWVGNFNFKNDKKMQLNLSQSWAKTRIIIDDLIIYEGGSNEIIDYEFKKGLHKIEVEYINNWHTTDFTMLLSDYKKIYKYSQMKNFFDLPNDYELWYVSTYESRKKDHSIDLELKHSTKPIYLVLQSYSPVVWNISNPYNIQIDAILIGKSDPGTAVNSTIDKNKFYFLDSNLGATYTLYPKCSCVNSTIFNCSGGNIKTVNKKLNLIFDKNITGFSGKYGVEHFLTPDIAMDEKQYKKIEQKLQENEDLKQQCKKESNPDFNNIFEDKK